MHRSLRLLKISWICLVIISEVGFSNGLEASFSNVLQKLANDVLGVSEYQSYLDSKISPAKPVAPDAKDLVASIASSIEKNIRTHVDALQKFNNAVLKDLKVSGTATADPVPSCCHISGIDTDVRFQSKVDTNRYCRTTDTWPNTQFSANTLPVLQANLEATPMIKWQYFGARDGSGFVYPAVDICQDSYDPRLKSWYYATAGGTPKDLVILVDTSNTMAYTYGSSGIAKLKVAIDAASTIVETLTPNDRVGVIAFDEATRYPTGDHCYQNSLALATPQNKQTLSRFLERLAYVPKEAQYAPALRDAFRLLSTIHAAQPAGDRVRVILLLTDGRSDANNNRNEAFCTLREGNTLLNNSVVLMTFGIDPAMTVDQQWFLQAIAEQNFTSPCDNSTQVQHLPKVGIFTHLDEASTAQVLTKIGFYYDAFADSTPAGLKFSVPYNDTLGLGLVTSACLPVISDTQVLGVTCVDIALDLVFHDIINFKLGQLSYAYLIDSHGRTLLHPAVPQPETSDSDLVYVDISSIETASGSDSIKSSMMGGQSGSMRVNANLVQNRGSSQLEGVDGFNKLASYYWSPIQVMNISVCLVIVEGETKRVRHWDGATYPPVYLAEHIDMYNTTDPFLCKQWGQASSVAGSMVKLAPMSFLEPFNYTLVPNQMTPDTKLLQNFLEGKSNSAGKLTLQEGVREVVALTYALDNIWKNTTDSSYWQYTLFRYIGTEDGLFRQFPATRMAKEYDPTRRPWYTTAVGAGQTGITVSRPYEDTSGIILLTLCQTVYEGSKSGHIENDAVFGVMGLDITLQSFYNLLIAEFQPCVAKNNQRCFVIDNNGFIIVHKDYISVGPPSSAQHITSKEPTIAYDLMTENIMKNDSCADYADITLQSFWKVQVDQMRTISSCRIYPVPGSNIFIIAPLDNSGVANSCQCFNKQSTGEEIENGECHKNQICECPCYFSVDYDQCNGILQAASTKPCLPPTLPLHLSDVSTELFAQGAKLPDCRPCDVPGLFANETLCLETRKCCWNKVNRTCQISCPTTPTNPVNLEGTANAVSPIILICCHLLLFFLL